MGAGKTTIGKKLAKELKLSFIDLDWYIEQRYHKTIKDLFVDYGESVFREIEKKMLHEVTDIEDVVISTGGGVPCFSDNMNFMNANGATIYLQLSSQQLFDRLKNARQSRPLLRDKSEDELLEYITSTLEKRNSFYKQAMLIFKQGNLSTVKDVHETTLALIERLKMNNMFL